MQIAQSVAYLALLADTFYLWQFLGINQYCGLMVFVVLCPGAPEGSTCSEVFFGVSSVIAELLSFNHLNFNDFFQSSAITG